MIFVDTWAWVALACKRDQHHHRVRAEHRRFVATSQVYVTTDFVLSELIAHLYTTLAPTEAQDFINALLATADAGKSQLVHDCSISRGATRDVATLSAIPENL